jgi:hypothetical protein
MVEIGLCVCFWEGNQTSFVLPIPFQAVRKYVHRRQAWWCIPVIPALKRLRHEDHELQVSLGYVTRPHLKNHK